MTASEIRADLPLLAPCYLCDLTYAKPTFRWLSSTFYPWFWEHRTNLGLKNWTRKNDCDNFARAYAQAAADAHALTSGNELEGLAVGEFWYHQAKGGGHAIVIAWTDLGRVFIEPQTGFRMNLTEAEIDSCFFVRV